MNLNGLFLISGLKDRSSENPKDTAFERRFVDRFYVKNWIYFD